MFRIGILGSDNSHALMFAKLCNIPNEKGNYLYDDVRITAIYGYDDAPEHTEEVAEQGRIAFVAESPEDFYGQIDAVMVVYRHGREHVSQILPFIEKGYPVWIDKPIAESLQDIETLRSAVKKNNTLITGGSTIKYNYEILTLQNKVKSGMLGEVTGGFMNFPGDLNSEYGGIFFYGSHLCEMCMSVFGYDVRSVFAAAAGAQNIMVNAKYDDKQVALHFDAKAKRYMLIVNGTQQSAVAEMDISIIYRLGFERFVQMLRSKIVPLDFEDLVKPVYMLHAIKKSLDTGKEVSLDEV